MVLDGARVMNSSLHAKLDLEKKTHEVTHRELQVSRSMLSAYYQSFSYPQEEIQKLLYPRNNLDKLYQNANSSLTTLERSHRFTMAELKRKMDELKESHDEVLKLSKSLSLKDSIIKELRASKKLVSQELEAARLETETTRHDMKVFEDDRVTMKAWCDKAMDKVIRAGQILMWRPSVVVPDDIMVDVLVASGTMSVLFASCGPIDNTTRGDAPV
jgi:predicted RNase H-like nuclease (RuvC/YqgF family)